MDKIIRIESHEQARTLCGMHDSNIRLIEKEFKVKITLRGEHLKLSGTATNIKKAEPVIYSFLNNSPPVSARQIGPKTLGQRDYVNAIKEFDIVFGVGPAGTGKTYLAMACAVDALKKQEVRRIILTRPAIEAGESLGFLPGDMHDKISPYLRPL
ncbi:MAG: PhoH family protein, partial [Candidatus Omnitrophota bacterium]